MLPVAAATLPAAAVEVAAEAAEEAAVSAPGAMPAQPAIAAVAPTTPATFRKSLRVIFFITHFSFSLGVSLSEPDCVFQPSSAALPLFTVFVRLCCLNYIQFGHLSQERSSAGPFHFATQINFLPKSIPEIVLFWNKFRNLTRIIVSR